MCYQLSILHATHRTPPPTSHTAHTRTHTPHTACRYLKIEGQHYFTSLSSILPNLEGVTDYVHIHDCNGLVKDVAGFASLVKVGSYVTVHGNPNLEVLDNGLFPNLTFAGGGVRVYNNAKLTNMTDYLPSLENSTGRVSIYSNHKLAAMANVCESLVTAAGVQIINADGLASLDSTTGFSNLATSTSYIEINHNAELLTINGVFPALTAVAGIHISVNAKLHTVGPARFGTSSSLRTLAGEFAVRSNAVLADVSGLQGFACNYIYRCPMVWHNNPELDQTDVCGVWDSMTMAGTAGPGLGSGTCGDGPMPCYGSNTAANC